LIGLCHRASGNALRPAAASRKGFFPLYVISVMNNCCTHSAKYGIFIFQAPLAFVVSYIGSLLQTFQFFSVIILAFGIRFQNIFLSFLFLSASPFRTLLC
jgi:hypothetical protein